MFCGKCGAQLEDDAKFCPACGAVIEQNTASEKQKPSGSGIAKIMKSPSRMIGVAAVVLVVILAVVLGFGGKSPEKIAAKTSFAAMEKFLHILERPSPYYGGGLCCYLIVVLFFPSFLERYIAASALSKISSGESPSLHCEMPQLIVIFRSVNG